MPPEGIASNVPSQSPLQDKYPFRLTAIEEEEEQIELKVPAESNCPPEDVENVVEKKVPEVLLAGRSEVCSVPKDATSWQVFPFESVFIM